MATKTSKDSITNVKLYIDDEVFFTPWSSVEYVRDPEDEQLVVFFEPTNGPDPHRVHMVPASRLRRVVEID